MSSLRNGYGVTVTTIICGVKIQVSGALSYLQFAEDDYLMVLFRRNAVAFDFTHYVCKEWPRCSRV
jgi:hypothetical protein